jgi:hypothetical protein
MQPTVGYIMQPTVFQTLTIKGRSLCLIS